MGTYIKSAQIAEILADDVLLGQDGIVDPIQAEIIIVARLNLYFLSQSIGRLAYARTNIEPLELNQPY
ncbi:hypothetical protein [Dyadobacter sediminis]|uniref:Uncharacterized protein n=1 Tax=Dyadobacter sediminis TaxID=1493691 RepID=A0A5R9K785_9BACT|nr:hypothetical protein [Dyadobacter sediminis]TLU89728.1 hypothetical protein FEM55_19510 [Dyadobacter sediminis]GGC13206.1 hypothetical protein GCM10011325_45190 [Dyadobacter sediminis]